MNTKGEFFGLSVATAAGMVMLAGCATNTQEPVPAPSISVESVVPIGPEVIGSEAMDVQYVNTDGVVPELSTIQSEIGDAAIDAVLLEPFTVMVNGTEQTVRVSIPAGAEERSQTIVFIPNSKNAGDIFSEYGLLDHAHQSTNVTLYGVNYDANGELIRSGPSLSVVGQEYDNAGPFRAIATERCQPLEMVSLTDPITDTNVYDGIKEAICNSLGYAADAIMLRDTYAEYEQRHGGVKLGDDVNSGHDIEYPVLSQVQFDLLSDRLNSLGD